MGGDTEFPEYDPTPYGGGLDLEELYGKPIVPSEKSCYAPSEAASSVADGEEDDKASVISAYGVELPDFDIDKRNPPNEGKLGKTEEEAEKGSAPQPWKPIYPTPEYHLRDSDLVLPFCNCATPNHCTCPYNIFSFKEEQEDEECLYTHHDPSSPDHVANRVAQWLFSSSYI